MWNDLRPHRRHSVCVLPDGVSAVVDVQRRTVPLSEAGRALRLRKESASITGERADVDKRPTEPSMRFDRRESRSRGQGPGEFAGASAVAQRRNAGRAREHAQVEAGRACRRRATRKSASAARSTSKEPSSRPRPIKALERATDGRTPASTPSACAARVQPATQLTILGGTSCHCAEGRGERSAAKIT